ncbi:hypothetical protein ACP70R_037110 [Stipagrostis hirtigluma subsp. patula]
MSTNTKMRGDFKALDPQDPNQQGDDKPFFVVVGWTLLLTACYLLLFCGLAYVTARARYVHPRFSVEIQGLERDLSGNSTVSGPAFNLTIHVDNKQHRRRVCWDDMAVVVYYNEATSRFDETSIGSSWIPAFCVDKWSETDLDVSLPKDGVFLPQRLRDKMALERQGQGMELSVEIKPIDPDDASTKCLQVCDIKLGQSPATMPCTQFCNFV